MAKQLRSKRIRRTVLGAAAGTILLSACGPLGGGGDTTAEGEVVGSGGEAGGSGVESLALPVTARYGYLDLTVAALETSDDPPPEAPDPETATWVAVDLEIDSQIDGHTYTIPPGLFTLRSDDVEYIGQTADDTDIEVGRRGQAAAEATVWFELPEGDPLADPWLRINESGYEPLEISLTGAEMPPQTAEVTMEGDFQTKCESVVFDEPGVAGYNVGLSDGGEAHPAPNGSTLGRAPEDELYVSFPVTVTESCDHLGSFFSIQGGCCPILQSGKVGDYEAPLDSDVGQPNDTSVSAHIVFQLPEDSTDPLELTWGFEETQDTTASLETLADLVAD